jgi:hypothetical protein
MHLIGCPMSRSWQMAIKNDFIHEKVRSVSKFAERTLIKKTHMAQTRIQIIIPIILHLNLILFLLIFINSFSAAVVCLLKASGSALPKYYYRKIKINTSSLSEIL